MFQKQMLRIPILNPYRCFLFLYVELAYPDYL